jgi:hypothetical protein
MNKFLISIIVIASFAYLSFSSKGIKCEKQITKRYPLRKFGIKFGDLKEILSAEKLRQKIILELEKQEKELRIVNEEAKRRRIYEKFLLKFQQGSRVLSDFHTNLF